MKLSVIIPVYKVEHTLERCVKSVLEQDVDNIEIILVDDGSPDNCPAICENLAESNNRIKVIHKKNGGLSDARNAGLDIATGEYVTFVDSDDYLMADTYPVLIDLLQCHQDVDMLEYILKQEDNKRHKVELNDEVFCSSKDYWLKTMAWKHAYAVNKIYKRSLFNGCRYAKGHTFEDLLILPQLLRHCSKIATTTRGTYVYTVNMDGISKKVNIKSVYSLLVAEAKSAWVMKTMPWSRNGKDLYYYICCRCYDILRLLSGKKL